MERECLIFERRVLNLGVSIKTFIKPVSQEQGPGPLFLNSDGYSKAAGAIQAVTPSDIYSWPGQTYL